MIKSTLSNHVLLKEEEINISPESRVLSTSTVFDLKSGYTNTVLNDRRSTAVQQASKSSSSNKQLTGVATDCEE